MINPESFLEENKGLFEYIEVEKSKFYNQAKRIKVAGITMVTIFVVLYFFPRFIETIPLLASIITTLILLLLALLPFKMISNNSILPSKITRLFYRTYKMNLINNIIKLISEDLNYRPQNRIINKIILQSNLFGDKITEYKGRNLISGRFDNSEIQMSEMQIWKGLHRLFSGFFVFISNIDKENIDEHSILALNGKSIYKDNNLYIAFPGMDKLFEIKIEKSNQSIEDIKNQTKFLLSVIGIIENSVRFTKSKYEVSDLTPISEEYLKSYKYFKTSVTKELYILASTQKRYFTLLIDMIAITGIYFLVLMLLIPLMKPILSRETSQLLCLIVFPITAFLYYSIAETIFLQTIGKVITKTRVISTTGEKPSFRDILIRSISRFIPFGKYSFINNDIGLHDRLSNTIVIRTDIKA